MENSIFFYIAYTIIDKIVTSILKFLPDKNLVAKKNGRNCIDISRSNNDKRTLT